LWLPAQWRGVSKIVYSFREDYEPELALLPRLFRSGETFVDAGASFGVYSLVASRIAGEKGRVLAFEPAVATRSVLKRNIRLNGVTNIRVFHAALNDRAGRACLSNDPDPSRNALLPRGDCDHGSESIETVTFDDALTSEERSRVSVFKLDIEGAEELALRGASKTLRGASPHVIFEVNPEAAARLSLQPDGAWRFLDAHGYSFYRVDGTGALLRLEQQPAGGNVIAIHPARRREESVP